jgi:hypothetical protein
MRESTSWNQANGSTFTNSHDATKLRSTATVLPPRSLPTKVQFAAPHCDAAQAARCGYY